jgi:hypothetical protein
MPYGLVDVYRRLEEHMPASSGEWAKQTTGKEQAVNRVAGLAVCFLLGLLFGPENWGNMLVWNGGKLLQTTWRHIPEDILFILNLCSALRARDQVLHPYKTKGKIVGFYIFIFWSSDPFWIYVSVSKMVSFHKVQPELCMPMLLTPFALLLSWTLRHRIRPNCNPTTSYHLM